MDSDKQRTRLAKLDNNSRTILALCALGDKGYSRQSLYPLAEKAELRQSNGRQLSRQTLSKIVSELLEQGYLENGSYSSVHIAQDIQDFVAQETVREGRFSALSKIVQQERSVWGWTTSPHRDCRIAFYEGDTEAFFAHLKASKKSSASDLLHPFNREIFDGLPKELREWYLIAMVPGMITRCDREVDILHALEETIEQTDNFSMGLMAAWLDLAVAQGSLESLRFLNDISGGKHPEVRGCIALLEGDLDQALSALGSVMPGGRRRGKLNAAQRLPGVLQTLLLFSLGSLDTLEKAQAIVDAGSKRTGQYQRVLEVIGAGIAFKTTPSSVTDFTARLRGFCRSPLDTLVAGYLAKWLLSEDDTSFRVPNLPKVAKQFRAFGLDWFSAEALTLAGRSAGRSKSAKAKKSKTPHESLGAFSLVHLAVPEPVWQRSLSAIAELAEGDGVLDAEVAVTTERIIWECSVSYGVISLTPFHQKRQGRNWSKGRKVALSRLYDEFNNPAMFGFLTEQDLAICRTLEATTERNYYGYPETYYTFNTTRVVRTLVGHPLIYPEGERQRAMEFVEQAPHLKVARNSAGAIALSVDPKPDREYEGYTLCVESPHRVVVTFFEDKHLKLNRMLGGTLEVPASAAAQVLQSVQKLASVISVHSELDDATGETGERIHGDARPHIHLLPHQEGLQAELYVYPFGDSGPFYHPGIGGETLFANVGGKPMAAARDLTEELRSRDDLLETCPVFAAHSENGTSVCCPAPEIALELLVELEALAASDRAVLHWPRGKSLTLAGHASPASLHLNLRKDRDMFAASGHLTVDPELTLDLMKLIDLVEATPSRFVRMDDGRFLALTTELKQRIEELALYGDRHGKGGKLRFPRVRAAVLQSLDESIHLKTDPHWKAWVLRIREAGDVQAEAPSTFQAEMRDYQREGFQWLARLASWGVGGCLADDMGLGKTIQALALLLHRATGGAALVIAPASVAFNWVREAARFAPSLNVRLFGEGDRSEHLDNLQPRDVVVCTYGLLNTESKRLQAITWHTLILDEAQMIKNETTQRSQAAKRLDADFRLIMTGTPLENHLGELWNLFEFINPGLLGSQKQFQERFAAPIEVDHCRQTRRRLKRLIQPFILRRTKSQVLEELPSRTEIVRKVILGDEEAALYEALRQRALEKLQTAGGGGARHLQILAEIMRLRRACCHPSLVLDGCGIAGTKLALFSETIDELIANHHKALVFSQFVDHLTLLRDELDRKRIAYQYLDGSTPTRQRQKCIEAFQTGEGDVFLISLKAGGLGLNLTAADFVIHMDPWWNPAVEDQASDRAHRLGQTRPVTIYRFITQSTVEEKIAALHTEKRALADSLLEGADMSGKLSAEELLGLIRE